MIQHPNNFTKPNNSQGKVEKINNTPTNSTQYGFFLESTLIPLEVL